MYVNHAQTIYFSTVSTKPPVPYFKGSIYLIGSTNDFSYCFPIYVLIHLVVLAEFEEQLIQLQSASL
jgi:hypothetical protein